MRNDVVGFELFRLELLLILILYYVKTNANVVNHFLLVLDAALVTIYHTAIEHSNF